MAEQELKAAAHVKNALIHCDKHQPRLLRARAGPASSPKLFRRTRPARKPTPATAASVIKGWRSIVCDNFRNARLPYFARSRLASSALSRVRAVRSDTAPLTKSFASPRAREGPRGRSSRSCSTLTNWATSLRPFVPLENARVISPRAGLRTPRARRLFLAPRRARLCGRAVWGRFFDAARAFCVVAAMVSNVPYEGELQANAPGSGAFHAAGTNYGGRPVMSAWQGRPAGRLAESGMWILLHSRSR